MFVSKVQDARVAGSSVENPCLYRESHEAEDKHQEDVRRMWDVDGKNVVPCWESGSFEQSSEKR